MAAIFEEFANGDAFNASDFNTYSMRQAIIACDNQTDRDAIATPQEGLTVYRKDLDTLQIYDGSSWKTQSPSWRAAKAVVATSQTTTSTTYTDLATVGPSVTVDIGASGLALVSFAATMQNTVASAQDILAVAVSGATTVAASDSEALQHLTTGTGDIRRYGLTTLMTGLNAGSNTFKLQYRVQSTGSGSGTGTFSTRSLLVVPL